MTIMTVDNDIQRLDEITRLLRKACPADIIVKFADPFWAGQFSHGNYVHTVFIDAGIRPSAYSCCRLEELIRRANPDVTVYYVADSPDGGQDASSVVLRPVTAEAIQRLIHTLTTSDKEEAYQ